MSKNNPELSVLELADYSEKFEESDSSAYLIINKEIKDYPCMFGFLELENDEKIVKALFKKIANRAKKLGYKNLIGPMNYNTWFSYRLATSRFDLKLFPDCDNPEFYPELLEKIGFEKLYTYRSASVRIKNNPLIKKAGLALKLNKLKGYKFKLFRGASAKEHLREIYNISIDAFKGSKLYTEISYETFEKLYLSWIDKIDMRLYMAFKNGEPAGYVFGYQNPKGKQFIIKTVATAPKYQGNNVYISLMSICAKDIMKDGFDSATAHFQCEQRESFKRFPKEFESDEKKYAIYKLELK